MHLFGDPTFPKKNLTMGAFLLTLSSFQFGSMVERLIWANNTSRIDFIFLVLWIGLLLAAIKIFRLGLASVPPDRNQRLNKPGSNSPAV
jgi:hypothetical protein